MKCLKEKSGGLVGEHSEWRRVTLDSYDRSSIPQGPPTWPGPEMAASNIGVEEHLHYHSRSDPQPNSSEAPVSVKKENSDQPLFLHTTLYLIFPLTGTFCFSSHESQEQEITF